MPETKRNGEEMRGGGRSGGRRATRSWKLLPPPVMTTADEAPEQGSEREEGRLAVAACK
jgi:hypothetical protein